MLEFIVNLYCKCGKINLLLIFLYYFVESKFWLELPPETPAFVCERVGVELELCRVADMTVVEDLSRQRRNMLYVSRGQLKKHSSTALNVSVSVRYIAQQVINYR